MRAGSKFEQVEQQYGLPMVTILHELYGEHGSGRAVAAALGVDQATLSKWLLQLGLEQTTVLVPRRQRRAAATIDPAQLQLPLESELVKP